MLCHELLCVLNMTFWLQYREPIRLHGFEETGGYKGVQEFLKRCCCRGESWSTADGFHSLSIAMYEQEKEVAKMFASSLYVVSIYWG